MNELDIHTQLIAKLHGETALIGWHDLQRFFAQGKVLWLHSSLDLVEVAAAFAEDNTDALSEYIKDQRVRAPENDQARKWYAEDSQLWSVVVAPYVLVQDRE